MLPRPARDCVVLLLLQAVGAPDPVIFRHGECDVTGRCYPSIRIGALAGPTPAGTLLAFAEGRIEAPVRQVRILLKRSSDGGRSWSPRAKVAAFVGPNGTSGNPAPTVTADGSIALLFQHMPIDHHPSYRFATCALFVRFSRERWLIFARRLGTARCWRRARTTASASAGP